MSQRIALLLLCSFTACGGNSAKNENETDNGGAVGTGTGGTAPQGQGGTDPQGQGGTGPQGTTSPGQGGTVPQGTTAQGQGTASATGSSATASGSGGASSTGASSTGAGGASACEDQCYPCAEGQVIVECHDQRCVCEAIDNPDKAVHADLLACDLDEPCPPSVKFTEPGRATWEGGTCLLEALRDRTPGVYHHEDAEVEDGYWSTDYAFLVGGGDEVLVLRITFDRTTGVRAYLPVSSCTLKSYDALDACVTAGTDVNGDTTGICETIYQWFDACEEANDPMCPAE